MGTSPQLGTHSNVQRFRGGLIFQAHSFCVSLNSMLESTRRDRWRKTSMRTSPQMGSPIASVNFLKLSILVFLKSVNFGVREGGDVQSARGGVGVRCPSHSDSRGVGRRVWGLG